MRDKMELEDKGVTSSAPDMRDDEYRHAGSYEPKVLITTARDPSQRLTQFAKVFLFFFVFFCFLFFVFVFLFLFLSLSFSLSLFSSYLPPPFF